MSGEGTWAPYPTQLANQFTIGDGTTFHQFFYNLNNGLIPGVNCMARAAKGGVGATGCCHGDGLNYPEGSTNPPPLTGGGGNCNPGCLCCLAYQLQQAGAQQADIDTYLNAVIQYGCGGQLCINGYTSGGVECYDGTVATEISQFCHTNCGQYTGNLSLPTGDGAHECQSGAFPCNPNCTAFVPADPKTLNKNCPSNNPTGKITSWIQSHKFALIFTAAVILLLLALIGYYL